MNHSAVRQATIAAVLEMDGFENMSPTSPASPWRRSAQPEAAGSSAIQTFIDLQRSLVSQTHSLLERQQEILETLQEGEGSLEAVLPTLERIARRDGGRDVETIVTQANMSPRPLGTARVRGDSTESAPRRERQPGQSRREAGLHVDVSAGPIGERAPEHAMLKKQGTKVVQDCCDLERWEAQAIQQKLDLSLKGSVGSAAVKASHQIRRIMRPEDHILSYALHAWKLAVRGSNIMDDVSTIETIHIPDREDFFPIHPHGLVRVMLDLVGLVIIIYELIAIPLYLAFSQLPGYVIEEPSMLVKSTLVFWSAECILSFNTAYFNHSGILVEDRYLCFVNHLKTWFIVDVLTVGVEWMRIFFDILLESSGGLAESFRSSTEAAQLLRLMRIARMIKVFRLLRILKLRKLVHTIYDRFFNYVEWVQLLLQIVQNLGMVLVLTHQIGCVWYGFSVHLIGSSDMTWVEYYLVGKEGEITEEKSDLSLKYHYFTALHWAITQVSGNTEIMPQNWQELALNIFVLCLTLIVFSSFVSSMTVAVTRLRNLHTAEEKPFALLRKYFRDHNIPADLAMGIYAFLEEKQAVLMGKVPEHEVDLLGMLPKGLYSQLMRVKQEPKLRQYPVFRQLHSSEPANDLMALISAEACSRKVFGPGEKVYAVDDTSRGMYFLMRGDYELREYRENDFESFSISAPKANARDGGVPGNVILPNVAWSSNARPTYTVTWLAEFSLFQPRSHDTMLIAGGYCEVLHVNRQSFSALARQFPILHATLQDANRSRHDHAVFLMGSESQVGDWIRPRSRYMYDDALEEKDTFDARRRRKRAATVPTNGAGDFTTVVAAAGL
jgi:hypothetical protein